MCCLHVGLRLAEFLAASLAKMSLIVCEAKAVLFVRETPTGAHITDRSDSDSGVEDSLQSASARATCASKSLESVGARSASPVGDSCLVRDLNSIVRNSPVEGSRRKISTSVAPSMSGKIASNQNQIRQQAPGLFDRLQPAAGNNDMVASQLERNRDRLDDVVFHCYQQNPFIHSLPLHQQQRYLTTAGRLNSGYIFESVGSKW